MIPLLTNPASLSDGVIIAIIGLFSGGIGWVGKMIYNAAKAWRPKSERAQAKVDKEDRAAIDITEKLQELARGAVAEVRNEIDIVRRDLATERDKTRTQGSEIARLTARVAQLETVIRANHLEVPEEVLPS